MEWLRKLIAYIYKMGTSKNRFGSEKKFLEMSVTTFLKS